VPGHPIQGESPEYRRLRNELLAAEITLKDERERVAQLRRQLPMGAAVKQDYVFREGPHDLRNNDPSHFFDTRFSTLFQDGKDTLIVDHLMYAPKNERACPMCSMWADGYDATDADQHPAVSVFKRLPNGEIHHFYTTEGSLGGGHHRGIDLFSPVWNLFDLLPEGRENWMPKHFYDSRSTAAV
jgi:predicted dithiol-disulfide oxidoreductase (DUF899 family)